MTTAGTVYEKINQSITHCKAGRFAVSHPREHSSSRAMIYEDFQMEFLKPPKRLNGGWEGVGIY
jgi:hypothetical protein